ncbi:MAG: hypothetical protein ABWZ76_00365 [Acidimicrobiales bacterium]
MAAWRVRRRGGPAWVLWRADRVEVWALDDAGLGSLTAVGRTPLGIGLVSWPTAGG